MPSFVSSLPCLVSRCVVLCRLVSDLSLLTFALFVCLSVCVLQEDRVSCVSEGGRHERTCMQVFIFPTSACTSLASSSSANQLQTLFRLFSSVTGTGPQYLADIHMIFVPSRRLRSSPDTRLFQIPSVNTKSTGQRTLAYQGPTVWNKLPQHQACSFPPFFQNCVQK